MFHYYPGQTCPKEKKSNNNCWRTTLNRCTLECIPNEGSVMVVIVDGSLLVVLLL